MGRVTIGRSTLPHAVPLVSMDQWNSAIGRVPLREMSSLVNGGVGMRKELWSQGTLALWNEFLTGSVSSALLVKGGGEGRRTGGRGRGRGSGGVGRWRVRPLEVLGCILLSLGDCSSTLRAFESALTTAKSTDRVRCSKRLLFGASLGGGVRGAL